MKGDLEAPEGEVERAILDGIASRRLMSFEYDGLPRVAEPHAYGVYRGKRSLLCWQLQRPGSETGSRGLPGWRRMEAARIRGAVVLEERFAENRYDPGGKHHLWDHVIARAELG